MIYPDLFLYRIADAIHWPDWFKKYQSAKISVSVTL